MRFQTSSLLFIASCYILSSSSASSVWHHSGTSPLVVGFVPTNTNRLMHCRRHRQHDAPHLPFNHHSSTLSSGTFGCIRDGKSMMSVVGKKIPKGVPSMSWMHHPRDENIIQLGLSTSVDDGGSSQQTGPVLDMAVQDESKNSFSSWFDEVGSNTTKATTKTTDTISSSSKSSSSATANANANANANATANHSDDKQSSVQQQQKKQQIILKLLELGRLTNRGFVASTQQQKEARRLIYELAKYNPTPDPLREYYDSRTITKSDTYTIVDSNNNNNSDDNVRTTKRLSGKWTLVYTDAPDITGLDIGKTISPLPPPAELGRIGQECQPELRRIINVIEWKQPMWVSNLFHALPEKATTSLADNNHEQGDDADTTPAILQKVVLEVHATDRQPTVAELTLKGLEWIAAPLQGDQNVDINNNNNNINQSSSRSSTWQDSIQRNGAVVGMLSAAPIRLEGPMSLPFGQFEVLYLDDEMRIIKTGQNYVAVNVRIPQPDKNHEAAWF